MQNTYIPVLLQIFFAVAIPVVILAASHLFGQRAKKNKIKDGAYECGLLPEAKPHPRFSVKFYVTAMLFILFDIEVVFLLPWATVYREFVADNIPVVLPLLAFLGVIVFGLIYEVRRGALVWDE